MALPAISRAYWTNTFHCQSCRKPRPVILQSTVTTCVVCKKKRNYKKVIKSRALETPLRTKLRRQKDLEYKRSISIPQRRARDAYYKVRARSQTRGMKSIPTRSNIENITPIYDYAYKLETNDPAHQYTVEHIYSLLPTSKGQVCGLHTIKNLRIRKTRR